MPTAAERQALAFLAGVALLGGGVRVWQQHYSAPGVSVRATTVQESVEGQLSAVDAARSNRSSKKRTTSKAPKKQSAARNTDESGKSARNATNASRIVDVDVASQEELEELPRVGPALAARIVANRDSLGPFGSIDELGRVRGIGPALQKLLEPTVTFSKTARPRSVDNQRKLRKK